jgi:hypothetical protein
MVDDPLISGARGSLGEALRRDAAIQAAQRADALLADSDSEGCAIWKRILSGVGELTRTRSAEGERVN